MNKKIRSFEKKTFSKFAYKSIIHNWVFKENHLKLICISEYISTSTGSTIRNCDKVKTWLDQMF